MQHCKNFNISIEQNSVELSKVYSFFVKMCKIREHGGFFAEPVTYVCMHTFNSFSLLSHIFSVIPFSFSNSINFSFNFFTSTVQPLTDDIHNIHTTTQTHRYVAHEFSDNHWRITGSTNFVVSPYL